MGLTFDTTDADETRRLAARIGALLPVPGVVLLQGGLGAGKTTFTQGLAEGFGATGPVTSPTFTLIQEYAGPRGPLVHIDPYRLGSWRDVEELGFEEYLERDAVVAVEWIERLGPLKPADHLLVAIERLDTGMRRISLSARGASHEAVIQAMEDEEC